MIKKLKLEKYGITQYAMPIRQILAVQMQNDSLVVWVDDATEDSRIQTFTSLFTGDNSIPHAAYIATVQDKSLVYHVYAS